MIAITKKERPKTPVRSSISRARNDERDVAVAITRNGAISFVLEMERIKTNKRLTINPISQKNATVTTWVKTRRGIISITPKRPRVRYWIYFPERRTAMINA